MIPRQSIANMDEARLSKLLAERAAAVAKVAECDRRLSDLCRRYSREKGYRIILTVEQVKRAVESEKGAET